MVQFIHLPAVDSTSAHLRRIADTRGAAPEPWTVVLADRQTAGYGQHGRSWQSPGGGLYVSIALGPELAGPVFTLLAGVAALVACREASGAAGLGLKWVNDLVWMPPPPAAGGRKIGGLLAEVCHRRWLVLGVGINLAPVPGVADAGSLEEAAGRPVDRMELLHALLRHLDAAILRWREGGDQAMIDAWCADSVTIGQEVRVESGGETLVGRAVGLDADGRLLLASPGMPARPIASGTLRLADGSYA